MKPIYVFQTPIRIGEANSKALTGEERKDDLKQFEILARKVIEKYHCALVGLAKGYEKEGINN